MVNLPTGTARKSKQVGEYKADAIFPQNQEGDVIDTPLLILGQKPPNDHYNHYLSKSSTFNTQMI